MLLSVFVIFSIKVVDGLCSENGFSVCFGNRGFYFSNYWMKVLGIVSWKECEIETEVMNPAIRIRMNDAEMP